MTGFEILIIVLLVASLAWGYKKGIIVQTGSLLSFFVALAACRILGDAASDAVYAMMDGSDPSQSLMNRFMASCIGHIAVFAAAWIGVWLLARTVKFFAKAIHIGFLDRACGSVFMALKTAMIISMVLAAARTFAPNSSLATSESPVIKGVSEIAPFILGFVQQSAS